jgi:multiple sugar transport system ATP-binding protein
VTMRTSLQQLHARLGTTTVFVTHDQVEAMTLGQRVAVMRDGKLQQVDVPQRLYDDPTNMFVGVFIGSPSMNLIEGTIDDDSVSLGDLSIPLDRERRPRSADNGRVIVGIRPEAFEDVAFAPAGLPEVDVHVQVVEELGSDAFLFFRLDAEQVIVEDALSDQKEDATSLLAEEDQQSLFGARVDPRTSARVGDTVRLAVDPSRLYFFSPETGDTLLGNGAAAAA